MTLVARKVLRDLECAHALLEVEERPEQFRVLWVAGVALARAVGHVLNKVDSSRSAELRRAISIAYSGCKAERKLHRVFFDFILDERNSVLKEYEFGFLSGPTEVLIVPVGHTEILDQQLFCPLVSGHFAGEDCRDVLGMAIDWWHTHLDAIDSVVADHK
ncbi:MAG: hypothetical protein KDI75_06905 [Xanthomonadales bacterium]|nr:hypothetical protein [Xanthomonadales bacterium]